MSTNGASITSGAVLLLIGLLVFITSIINLRSGYISLSWPITQATIIKAYIEEKTATEGTDYIPVIGHEYFVDAQRYENDRINKRRDYARIPGNYLLTGTDEIYFNWKENNKPISLEK